MIRRSVDAYDVPGILIGHGNVGAVHASSLAGVVDLLTEGVGFAQRTVEAMGAVFGGRAVTKHYTNNECGQATFASGPTNIYLLERFFGSNPESREIALTEEGKD